MGFLPHGQEHRFVQRPQVIEKGPRGLQVHFPDAVGLQLAALAQLLDA